MQPTTDFDDLIYPRGQSKRSSEYGSADVVVELLGLGAADVQGELTAFEQEDLGAADDLAATRALSRAAWWMLAKLRKTSHILEDYIPQDEEQVKGILLSRAVYELQLATGQSGVAGERRISIEEMATALFGTEFSPAEKEGSAAGSAVGVVAKPHRKKYPE
jgi:hypothetical protein